MGTDGVDWEEGEGRDNGGKWGEAGGGRRRGEERRGRREIVNKRKEEGGEGGGWREKRGAGLQPVREPEETRQRERGEL
jgi:hypothetical protein